MRNIVSNWGFKKKFYDQKFLPFTTPKPHFTMTSLSETPLRSSNHIICLQLELYNRFDKITQIKIILPLHQSLTLRQATKNTNPSRCTSTSFHATKSLQFLSACRLSRIGVRWTKSEPNNFLQHTRCTFPSASDLHTILLSLFGFIYK